MIRLSRVLFLQSHPVYSAHRSFASPALTQFREILNDQLTSIKDAGTYKSERVITSPQKTNISVLGRKKTVLNFCANNYLGLAVSRLYILPHHHSNWKLSSSTTRR